MKDAERDMLLTLYGRLCGSLEPQPLDGRAFCAQRQLRALWLDCGRLPYRAKGRSPAETKRLERALTALRDAGLVVTAKGETGLTLTGLTEARRLTGHPQLADTLCALDYITTLIGTGHEWIDGEQDNGLISESSLAGGIPWPPNLDALPVSVVDCLLPLILAGLVDFGFRPGCGCPLYRLTRSGRELAQRRLAHGAAEPKAWRRLVRAYKPRPPECYATAWAATFNAMPEAVPLRPNEIHHDLGPVLPRSMTNELSVSAGAGTATETKINTQGE